MLPINGKLIATADVILIKALTKHAYNKKNIHEGMDLILLFPDQTGVMNLPSTTEALKNSEKTLENHKTISIFDILFFFNNSLLMCAVGCIWHQSDCQIRVCILHQSYFSIWISCTNNSIWVLFFCKVMMSQRQGVVHK